MNYGNPKSARTLTAAISKTTSGEYVARYEQDGFLTVEKFPTFGAALKWLANPKPIHRESTTRQRAFEFIDIEADT